eukprot:TRINITY_DN3204_c0_g1_i1.p1 TRINITY_DN3204_c0_g1~~TRINITY_DN3204_c0_g1_i1.p1  ORF type:complete len:379 (-),score=81.11 TRINITY_DN3204_c0_g1_i1:251-1327(-)
MAAAVVALARMPEILPPCSRALFAPSRSGVVSACCAGAADDLQKTAMARPAVSTSCGDGGACAVQHVTMTLCLQSCLSAASATKAPYRQEEVDDDDSTSAGSVHSGSPCSLSAALAEPLEDLIISLRLQARAEAIRLWCFDAGAAFLEEVAEGAEDLSEAADLEPLERRRLMAWAHMVLEDDAEAGDAESEHAAAGGAEAALEPTSRVQFAAPEHLVSVVEFEAEEHPEAFFFFEITRGSDVESESDAEEKEPLPAKAALPMPMPKTPKALAKTETLDSDTCTDAGSSEETLPWEESESDLDSDTDDAAADSDDDDLESDVHNKRASEDNVGHIEVMPVGLPFRALPFAVKCGKGARW